MAEPLDELRDSLAGDLLVEGDREYEQARLCFNLLIDRRPAAIARCIDGNDVAAALAFGQARGLEIAVRGGGHNPAGHCAVDDGLVIDLSRMRDVLVDPDTEIATCQGGATWLDFDAATQAHGLVTPGGVVGSTGVTGLTLGGGIGHLTAQYGLTCDNLVAAEVVSPVGEIVRASDDQNPELLWGLRGGGGNFGVVTEAEFRLHPLERVVGGRLEYEGEDVAEALRLFRELAVCGPRGVSIQAQLSTDVSLAPQLDVVPCYTGAEEEPEALRPLRAMPGLVNDSVRRQGFLEQQRIFDPGYGVDRNYWKGHFVAELPDELIDDLVHRMTVLGRSPGGILIESLHGAPKDVKPESAALGFRDAAFNVSVMASWTDPAHDEESIEWARTTAAAIEPWSVSGGYANYMQADEPLDRVRAAFGPDSFARLQALKSRYDPDNVLRHSGAEPSGAAIRLTRERPRGAGVTRAAPPRAGGTQGEHLIAGRLGDPGQFPGGQLILTGRRRARFGVPVLLRRIGRVVVLLAQPVQPRLPLRRGHRVPVQPGGILAPPGVRGSRHRRHGPHPFGEKFVLRI